MNHFNLLMSFHAVCQSGNISGAAKTLGISQPALTRQLQKLSEQLGVDLFIRRQRGVELTEKGRHLYQSTRTAVSALIDHLEIMKAQSKSHLGPICIGTLAEVGRSYVIPRVLSFSKDYPDIELDIQLLKAREILDKMRERALDFAILADKPKLDHCKISKLMDEKSLLVTRNSNVKDLLDDASLLSSRFVSHGQPDSLLNKFISTFFPNLTSKMKPHIVINDHAMIVSTLMIHDFYAVMPYHSVKSHLQNGSLRQAHPKTIHNTLWIVRPTTKHREVIQERLLEYLHRSPI